MKVTNKQLIECYGQLIDMKKSGNIIAYLLAAKIRQWENDNMVRINSILEKMKVIDMEYYEHTAIDGKPEFKQIQKEDGNLEYVMKEGKEYKDFQQAYDDMLKEETTMIL
jgi:hypothetical protein